MKKIIAILICSLAGSATGWAYGPYCSPVSQPVVVYCAPVYYTPPPQVVYVQRAPVVYAAPVVYSAPVCMPAPVVYARPAYCVPPVVQLVAELPLLPFWFGGGHHGGRGHGDGYRR